MATEKEMLELLGRALGDKQFRTALLEDPLKATASLGINLTEEQLAGLRELDLGSGLENLDERLSKVVAWR
jgi:hypothetical protein